MNEEEKVWAAFRGWYDALPLEKNGLPAKESLGDALITLENLLEDFDLNIQAHKTPSQEQVRGADSRRLKKILAKFGETRPFLSEGGWGNGGLFGIEYDLTGTAWEAVHSLLAHAKEAGKDGPVAKYLVGATLQLRYPDKTIRNTSYSTADEQTGEPGDFYVGDTAFHVTIAPTPNHYERCRRNVQEGRRVYLIVPDLFAVGARQNAEATESAKITVQSIEGFVSQNIDELASFSQVQVAQRFRELLDTYNKRVDAVERDKSYLIEIPPNLIACENDRTDKSE